MNELLEILKDQPFFEGLREADMRLLAAGASLRTFRADETLFREHEEAAAFYLIRSGRVALESRLPGRRAEVFMTLGQGEVLGWSWLMPPYRWHYSARALEETHAVHFDAPALHACMDRDPVLGYALYQRFAALIVQRLQAARLQAMDIYGGGDVGLGG
ncbi:cyclic nucleotide-binding protein [Thioalkalivibrio sulfidiphilus HL-EbGr7]|uniref:Cyclic nucleotide-binding protein n=1 Tax=Thioalkalivibrio sulfidiphilus (strain HL-EbGR7) TaxID=396588 RepID=B8GPQ4_THISH|nr:cyclic nucleotide-binding domain-containing protein [Thioalkalivibrio sulfidiphilus]ACL72221.1 cyclic nucleotide-binding protein [Thioalkalivibrio sulfidiphilus HL-EbGr7]